MCSSNCPRPQINAVAVFIFLLMEKSFRIIGSTFLLGPQDLFPFRCTSGTIRKESTISSYPIHCALFQSTLLNNPTCQNAGSLHEEIFPLLSHTISFQKYFFTDRKALPLY